MIEQSALMDGARYISSCSYQSLTPLMNPLSYLSSHVFSKAASNNNNIICYRWHHFDGKVYQPPQCYLQMGQGSKEEYMIMCTKFKIRVVNQLPIEMYSCHPTLIFCGSLSNANGQQLLIILKSLSVLLVITSLDWNNLVIAKNVSVASVVVKLDPWLMR